MVAYRAGLGSCSATLRLRAPCRSLNRASARPADRRCGSSRPGHYGRNQDVGCRGCEGRAATGLRHRRQTEREHLRVAQSLKTVSVHRPKGGEPVAQRRNEIAFRREQSGRNAQALRVRRQLHLRGHERNDESDLHLTIMPWRVRTQSTPAAPRAACRRHGRWPESSRCSAGASRARSS